jgi:tRNA/tmRNA/rRNA uracil-C5-methylase (TrmA/RlmC/RlmD family)
VARVRVESAGADFARAALVARQEDAPGRRPAPCRHAARCGGCAYQELAYEQQLSLKAAILKECLARAGAPWEGEIRLRSSPEEGWRSRCTFHVAPGPELRLGLREEGSHRVVDLDACPQLSPGLNGALRGIRGALAERPELARCVRDVELAESYDGNERVATLTLDLPPEQAAPAAARLGDLSWLGGLGVVARAGGRERFLPLRGEPYVRHEVAGLSLRAHARSFFQANRHLVGALVESVGARLPPGGRLLDLYAGIGLFALAHAQGRESIHAIEADPWAAEDARANGLAVVPDGRLRVEQGDVLRGLKSLPAEPGERIVLDPPRSGAGREVVEAVATRRPATVVYVSCDPPTLGRDLRHFAAHGYRATALDAFDLFPDTYHLEAVVALNPGL